jgi:hypothetical protein
MDRTPPGPQQSTAATAVAGPGPTLPGAPLQQPASPRSVEMHHMDDDDDSSVSSPQRDDLCSVDTRRRPPPPPVKRRVSFR